MASLWKTPLEEANPAGSGAFDLRQHGQDNESWGRAARRRFERVLGLALWALLLGVLLWLGQS